MLIITLAWLTHGTNTSIDDANNDQWRIPLGIQVIPAGILGGLILFFPEVRISLSTIAMD